MKTRKWNRRAYFKESDWYYRRAISQQVTNTKRRNVKREEDRKGVNEGENISTLALAKKSRL